MKILFVHPSVELYGADKILLYILEILHKDHKITVLLPKEGILINSIKEISPDIKIIIKEELPIVHSKLGLKQLMKLPFALKKFSRIFTKGSFDIVYCNTLATILLLYTNWSRTRVIHIHEIIENRILNLGFSMLTKFRAKKVICVSNHVKQRLLFSKKYLVVHNGIPDLNKNILNKSNDENKISFVLPGRFMPKKGQWFLINALKELPEEELEKCDFYLYGSPPPNRQNLEKELSELVRANNFEAKVHLCPFTKNIEEIYQKADVILVPSLMADPFPTTVLEALMFSKPVIATNHGGASEIIDESFGKLISPNDFKTFATEISFFINNVDEIKSFGENARKKYDNYLTLDCFEKRFIKELFK